MAYAFKAFKHSLMLLMFGVFLSGCAAGRSHVSVMSPGSSSSSNGAVAGNRGTIWLRDVKDARVFYTKPRDPSEPSLGGSSSDDIKARAFGRKRGGFGMALGDVVLEPGQSVAGLVRDNTKIALEDAGYKVVMASTPGAIPLDVTIMKLWAWFTPGAFQVTLEGKASIDLAIQGRSSTTVVAHTSDDMGFVVDADWVKTLQALMVAYRTNTVQQLALPTK